MRVPQFRQYWPRAAPLELVAPLEPAAVRDVDATRVHELKARQLLWIDVSDRDQVETVASSLGVAADTVARLTRAPRRAEVRFHTNYFHVTVLVAEWTKHGYEAVLLDCVAGQNWILTVHTRPVAFLDGFDERIRGDSQLGRLDAPWLAATLLHEHVASYVREIEHVGVELDRLDLAVMTGSFDEAVSRRLVELRRHLTRLRRLLAAHREIYGLLARPDFEILSRNWI